MIAVVGVSWTVAFYEPPVEDNQRDQWLATAQTYIEDGAYITAVAYLEQCIDPLALEPDLELEVLLEETYWALNGMSEYSTKYEALILEQMYREDADVDTFFKVYQYYLYKNEYSLAIAALRVGAQETEDSQFSDFYLENRYLYSTGYSTYDWVSNPYNGAVIVQSGDLYGLANSQGSLVLPCIYDKVSLPYDNMAVVSKGDEIYTVNLSNYRVALEKYNATDFTQLVDGRLALEIDGSFYEVNPMFGIIDTPYEAIGIYSNGFAAVQVDGKWGMKDTSDQWLLEPLFDNILTNDFGGAFYQNSLFVALDGGIQLLSSGTLYDTVYEDAKPFTDQYYAAVKMDGKWGFVNTQGELVIPCIYDDARSFSGYLAAVKSGDCWGYIGTQGEVAIDFLFQEARDFYNKVAAVKQEDSYSFITLYE